MTDYITKNAIYKYMNSIDSDDKVFAIFFMMLSFLMIVSLIGAIILIYISKCKNRKNFDNEEKSKSFLYESRKDQILHYLPYIAKKSLRKSEESRKTLIVDLTKKSEESRKNLISDLAKNMNISIVNEITFNESIRQDITNVHDDFEFYEIRSDVSTEYCDDLDNQIKWETLIRENVLKIPTKNGNNKSLPRKTFSNVRRNLLPEFDFSLASTL